jgi:hypothetical protein
MTNNVTRMYGVWKITLRKKGECEYIMLWVAQWPTSPSVVNCCSLNFAEVLHWLTNNLTALIVHIVWYILLLSSCCPVWYGSQSGVAWFGDDFDNFDFVGSTNIAFLSQVGGS